MLPDTLGPIRAMVGIVPTRYTVLYYSGPYRPGCEFVELDIACCDESQRSSVSKHS